MISEMDFTPTTIDLFCGCGGLSQGLSEAGFDVIWAVDAEEKAKPTYDENHSAEMTVGDIREIAPSELAFEPSDVDVVAGGPPCPTFSLVGRSKINSIDGQDVHSDERSLLYEEFLKFVEYFQPEAFLMENVKGMQSATTDNDEAVVDVITDQMGDIGYDVSVQLLDAANFGVPQHRERLFFIGNEIGEENPDMSKWETHREPTTEDEKQVKFPRSEQAEIASVVPEFTPNQTPKAPWNTVADGICDLPPVSPDGEAPPTEATEYEIAPLSEYQVWARDGNTQDEDHLHNHVCRGHNMRDLTLFKILGEGIGYTSRDIPDEHIPYRTDIFTDRYKKQHPNEPSSTILAHLYKDGNMFIHPTEARSLTVREAARLQSFKDTFEFPVARTHAYKQVGNAVPPLLAQALGTALQELLN